MNRPELDPSLPGFNWLTALDSLIANPEITDSQYETLADAASDWPTCACGELCLELPRWSSGAPDDDELRDLGNSFYGEVLDMDWEHAKGLFLKIEARTDELLKDL